ncbi:MAG: hypothetical protein AB3N64_08750 [Puniceicoccaceae bacterium]
MDKSESIIFHRILNLGQLTAMREWIKAGKQLHENKGRNHRRAKSALEIAVRSGFHGMVEMLLEEAKWSDEDLNTSLYIAGTEERADLMNLLLDHGAPAECASPSDVLCTMDFELINRFMKLGMDLTEEDAFYDALDTKRARPLLRLYKANREKYPELEVQIAKALVSAVEKKKVKWAILLLWAGADPTLEVSLHHYGPLEKDGWGTTAMEEAYQHADLEYIRALKLDRYPVNLDKILWYQSIDPKLDVIEDLLKEAKPQDLNTKANNSSAALESFVSYEQYSWSHDWYPKEKAKRRIKAIDMILKAGGRWDPDKDDFRHDRSGLASNGKEHVVQVVRLLMYTPGAAPFEKIWELCRTPKLTDMIRTADMKLWWELKDKVKAIDPKAATSGKSLLPRSPREFRSHHE